jgi:hypothetical protein
VSATRIETTTPITDHLWAIGFTIQAKADRLPVEIADGEGNTFKTNFEITAYPERGEARRLFAAKGPAKSEVKSNLPLEHFLSEQEQGTTMLKDLYTEQCARHLFEMLQGQAATISKPALALA